jgi:hypothetical protein
MQSFDENSFKKEHAKHDGFLNKLNKQEVKKVKKELEIK